MSADAANFNEYNDQENECYDPFNDPIMQRRAKSILSRLSENKSATDAVIMLLIGGSKGKLHLAYGDGMRLQFANPEPQFSDRNPNK